MGARRAHAITGREPINNEDACSVTVTLPLRMPTSENGLSSSSVLGTTDALLEAVLISREAFATFFVTLASFAVPRKVRSLQIRRHAGASVR